MHSIKIIKDNQEWYQQIEKWDGRMHIQTEIDPLQKTR